MKGGLGKRIPGLHFVLAILNLVARRICRGTILEMASVWGFIEIGVTRRVPRVHNKMDRLETL